MVKATNIASAINIKLLLSQAMSNYGWKFHPHQKWVMKSYNWLKTDRNISNASCQLSSGEYEADSTDDQCPDWLAFSFHDWPDLCCVVSKTRWRQRFRHPKILDRTSVVIIQSHYACKMCSNYPGIKLVTAVWRLRNFLVECSRHSMQNAHQMQNGSRQVANTTRMAAEMHKSKKFSNKVCRTSVF